MHAPAGDLDDGDPGIPERGLRPDQQDRDGDQRETDPTQYRQSHRSQPFADDTPGAGPQRRRRRNMQTRKDTRRHDHGQPAAEADAEQRQRPGFPRWPQHLHAGDRQRQRQQVGDAPEQEQDDVRREGAAFADKVGYREVRAGEAPGGILRRIGNDGEKDIDGERQQQNQRDFPHGQHIGARLGQITPRGGAKRYFTPFAPLFGIRYRVRRRRGTTLNAFTPGSNPRRRIDTSPNRGNDTCYRNLSDVLAAVRGHVAVDDICRA